MSSRNEDTRCKGVTKRGEPCRAAATAGGLCFFHANPNKAAELGRMGGRSKRNAAAETADPIALFSNDAIGVRDALGKIITDLLAGKLSSRVAASVVPFMRLQLLAFDAVDEMEKRVYERPYYGCISAARKRDNSSSEEPDSSVARPETSSAEHPASSSTVPAEIANVGKPEILNVGKPEMAVASDREISDVGKSGVSTGGWPEIANAADPEISNVGKSKISNGGWPEMAKLGEPEISNEENSEISSAVISKSSNVGKAENSSAESPDLSSFVQPVLPMEKILAMNRERQRQLAIADAQRARLSHAFGLDELEL
jgi:uncharacterized protein DUF5763